MQTVLWRQGLFLPDQPLIIITGNGGLPNVGFGQLEELWADYLQHYAQQWGGIIIFYCTPDCWHWGIRLKEWLINGLNWG